MRTRITGHFLSHNTWWIEFQRQIHFPLLDATEYIKLQGKRGTIDVFKAINLHTLHKLTI